MREPGRDGPSDEGEGAPVGDAAAPRRVAIVDDHALVRDVMSGAIADMPNADVVFSGDSLDELALLDPPPDLVVLDLDLHGVQISVADVEAIISRGSRVLVVSALASPVLVRRLARAGVAGFVPKRSGTGDSLQEAVREVLADRYWTTPALAGILANDRSPARPDLSEREQRALVLYATGLTLSSVGRRMEISPHTAKRYIDRVRAKYAVLGRDVGTKTGLYRAAVDDGLIEDDGDRR